MSTFAPAKRLPNRPNLTNLKKRAKQLLREYLAGDDEALQLVAAVLPGFAAAPDEESAASPLALHDAQLALARQYGFESWPKLKAHVEMVSAPVKSTTVVQGAGSLSEIEADVSLDVPMLPGRDFVTFPGTRAPLFIGRPKSISAVDRALEAGGTLFVVAQRERETDEPRQEDLYTLGTLVQIEQCERREDGTIKILIHVHRRARLELFTDQDYYMARVSPLPENDGDSASHPELVARVLRAFESYVERAELPPQAVEAAQRASLPGRLSDWVASFLRTSHADRQSLLECLSPIDRLHRVDDWLAAYLATEQSPPLIG